MQNWVVVVVFVKKGTDLIDTALVSAVLTENLSQCVTINYGIR